jgi:polar amino acid transport system ATP-binding protein
VTHEMRFALKVADRVMLMSKGRIVEEAPTAGIARLPKESEIVRYMRLSS